MGRVHELSDIRRDDRRLVDVTMHDLRKLIAAEIRAAAPSGPEGPLGVREFAALYRVDSKRVYEWIDTGMPCIRTGDQRGIRIWPDKARAWLEEHRG